MGAQARQSRTKYTHANPYCVHFPATTHAQFCFGRATWYVWVPIRSNSACTTAHSQTHTHACTHIHRHIHRYVHRHRHAPKCTQTHTQTCTQKHPNAHTYLEGNGHTDTYTDMHPNAHLYRRRHRHRCTHTQAHTHMHMWTQIWLKLARATSRAYHSAHARTPSTPCAQGRQGEHPRQWWSTNHGVQPVPRVASSQRRDQFLLITTVSLPC